MITYDAIGNRTGYTEAGRGTSTANNDLNTGVVSSTVTLQDPLTHTYTPNAANQYTQITHPDAFDVRGTRTAGATIAVNGVDVATPTPSDVSGYQTGGTGTIFRARVTNTAPSGTSTPDLYEPVKVTQNGTPLTVDDPIQYIAKPIETLTYDADGNLKTDGRWTYTWDAADRLIKMESPSFYQPAVVPVSPATSPASALVNVPAKVIEFAYDGLSRRIRKKVTEGTSTIVVWEAYVYDGWNMVLSVKLNPAVGASQGRPQSAIASYVWRPDMGSLPFARRNWQAAGGVRGLVMANYFTGANGGGIHLPVMDAMGNVTQVVRAGVQLNYNGDSMRSEFVYDYDAFGKETRSSTLVAGLNPDSFPFHYSTKFTDPETGFNYYGYRFYDPANGKWLSRDPIGERGGLNLYGMVGNDPVNGFDVLGLEGEFPWREEPATNNIVNCAGHATGCNHALEPDKDKSFNDVMKKKGYKCTKGVSALECKSLCGEECVELYFYKPKDANPDAKYPKNPIKSKGDSFGPGKDMDYHALRGIPGGGYDYQPRAAFKGSPGDQTANPPKFNPTPERPDYFQPDQIVEKYCCCKKK